MEPKGKDSRLAVFIGFAALVLAVFSRDLAALFRLACKSQLHSQALLVPAISAWLFFHRRAPLPPFCASPTAAVGTFIAAGALLAGAAFSPWQGTDLLAVRVLALLLILGGGWLMFLGWPSFRTSLFPLLFMLFVVPLPNGVVHFMSVSLQDGSAKLSYWTFAAMGWPVFKSGHVLMLPGLTLEVAEECSGINSTYALFITSVLAGQVLLKSRWKRLLFVAVVLPLGVLRNTFRIVSLAVLTIKVDPRIIDSPLHHRGGPIFFALSLIPLFGLLVLLWWIEQRKPAADIERRDHEQ